MSTTAETVSISADLRGAARGSYRLVYAVLGLAALGGLGLVVSGYMGITSFVGMLAGLAFLGLFATNLRIFIVVFVLTRGLMEIFLDPTTIHVGGLSFQVVGLLGAMILLGGIIYIVMNDIRVREVAVLAPMIIFLAASLPTTLLFSEDKLVGFKDWVGTASTIMLFVLIASIFTSKKDIKLLIAAVVISAIPQLVVGYWQLFTNSGNLMTEGFNRIYGTFQHPNQYAIYLGLVLLLLIPLLMETKVLWQRIGFIALSAALLFSMIFTYARAPWLTLLAGLFIVALVRYRKLFLAVPVLVVLLLVFVPSILDRFQEAAGFSEGQGSMFFRVEMWRFLLPHFYGNPVLGNGMGSFASYAETGLGYFYLPHNDYIRLLIDTGVVGLAAYLVTFYMLLRGAIRSYFLQKDPYFKMLSLVLGAVIVDYLLGGITENLFRAGTTQVYFWTIAGLVAATARMLPGQGEGGAEAGQQLKLPDV